ncbi:hypothetical protein COV16_03590 [Candidatus Woesearchaeota archaeon CG10_big_fil_rev_8_21_14_0_10_34_8]|nr:MAG: hypothetical protein COV16_03590 [Candidatus Woesearchaeota archaeon CG10_big_fil_rev_8_21_14_0_10_34_8]
MFSNKSQIDVQFNWIFILIVGAIILSFFVGVAVWYKGTQEQKIAADIVTKLDSLFMTAKESPKTARYTEIPQVELSFTCSATDCSDYGCPSYFSGGGISMSTETEALFTMRNLHGTNIITWSLEWDMPYKIANFLYLTNDAVRYVFVYDEDHKSAAHSAGALLAENSYITKETINIDTEEFSLIDKHDDFVRIVAFLDKGSLSEAKVTSYLGEREAGREHWDIIYIDGTAEAGTVVYEDGEVIYAGLPLLMGAIFSADSEFYSCNLQKTALQSEFVSNVYLKRTKELYNYFTLEDTERLYCSYYLGDDVQNAIENIASGLKSGEIDYDYVTELEENNAYAVIKSCPRVY